MDSQILYLGVLDKSNAPHFVSLEPGVNVITGKSSTGKSALIEIFDYCFGASEFTVPVGVITECASLYFVSMRIKGSYVILCRSEVFGGKGLIQEFSDEGDVHPSKFDLVRMGNADSYLPNKEYVKRLSRLFGLIITDVDEDLKERERRGRKKGTPSVRSFVSFLLQHQNLIANKHAIFYRFDEKEKREPVIEQFIVFLGLVDGDYFQLMQNLAEQRHQREVLERFKLPEAIRIRDEAGSIVRTQLDRYSAASGVILDLGDWKDRPSEAVVKAEQVEVNLDSLSTEHLEVRGKLEAERSSLIAERRQLERQLRLIAATEEQILRYRQIAEEVPTPKEGTGGSSYCHFCDAPHVGIESHANKLTDAITWLNIELDKLRSLPLSLAEDRNVQVRNLARNTNLLQQVLSQLSALDRQIDDFQRKRSHLEVAMAAKLGVIQALRTMANNPVIGIETEIEELKKRISALEAEVKERYDVVDHRYRVEKRLKELMRDISEGFDFESSYTPIDLRFDLETFELWAVKDEKKVFLRSMGSGANWLSCHLTLFLALHRYFCELDKTCVIPAVLFLDQPSQVYFPAILDTDSDFSPENIAMRSAEHREVDEDIKAVANLFSKLVKFCADTKVATGIEPQIIVTDHADKLKLDGTIEFQDLVRAKWRGQMMV